MYMKCFEKGDNTLINNIKGIIFDADNTIVDHRDCERQALEFLFKKIGEKYNTEYQEVFRPLDRELWDNVALNRATISKELIPEYRFKLFFNKICIPYNDYKKANELFQYGLEHSVALIEKADEVIEYLYNKNYMLFVATNGLVRLQKPRIINSNISKYISDIIVSEEVGLAKPNPIIFKTLLQNNNINSSEAIMIGDSLEKDIQGAKNANMKSIWYNPKEKNNNTNIIPDYEIKSLLELKHLF